MGFLDALMGRSKPKKANLDQLFALPSAAITLQVATAFTPTGAGAVAFRAAEGGAFATMQSDVESLLAADADTKVEASKDAYGFTWLVVHDEGKDASDLVTNLHAVNTSLESQGFGPMLLCSLMYFNNPQGDNLALVYLYKRGTFYPFVPAAGGSQQRNSALELQIRGVISNDVPIESDLSRWSPVWGAPGFDS
ncbi:hypothetical protein LWF01_02260 [Saxibacter everestensis]|uniref:Uncharacterized protein n=1 Tax=Saxibacter everestensis TaxID=2909229 RepID=A0ABY8QUJ1_9MICO|nr:hypothetical protein LWF01_02260 [Brevibacteriaceae bacterium ZFBP1038]